VQLLLQLQALPQQVLELVQEQEQEQEQQLAPTCRLEHR
jgi:hypothetical protein